MTFIDIFNSNLTFILLLGVGFSLWFFMDVRRRSPKKK